MIVIIYNKIAKLAKFRKNDTFILKKELIK